MLRSLLLLLQPGSKVSKVVPEPVQKRRKVIKWDGTRQTRLPSRSDNQKGCIFKAWKSRIQLIICKRQDRAAVKVQAIVRGKKARSRRSRLYRLKLYEADPQSSAAATKVQSYARGFISKRAVQAAASSVNRSATEKSTSSKSKGVELLPLLRHNNLSPSMRLARPLGLGRECKDGSSAQLSWHEVETAITNVIRQRDNLAVQLREMLHGATPPLPEGWIAYFDPHYCTPYYVHTNGQTTWTRPPPAVTF